MCVLVEKQKQNSNSSQSSVTIAEWLNKDFVY
jgi:hypothetical protein